MAAAVVLLPVLLAGATVPSDPGAELKQLIERRLEANARNDRAFYAALLASNFAILDRNLAPKGKDEYLESEFGWRPADYRGPVATVEDFRARVVGDTAVVTYRGVSKTPLGAQQFEDRTLRVEVYARQDGAWRWLSAARPSRRAGPTSPSSIRSSTTRMPAPTRSLPAPSSLSDAREAGSWPL